jgi:hypothetical protein
VFARTATASVRTQHLPVVTVSIPRWCFALLIAAVGVLWLVSLEVGSFCEDICQAGRFFH